MRAFYCTKMCEKSKSTFSYYESFLLHQNVWKVKINIFILWELFISTKTCEKWKSTTFSYYESFLLHQNVWKVKINYIFILCELFSYYESYQNMWKVKMNYIHFHSMRATFAGVRRDFLVWPFPPPLRTKYDGKGGEKYVILPTRAITWPEIFLLLTFVQNLFMWSWIVNSAALDLRFIDLNFAVEHVRNEESFDLRTQSVWQEKHPDLWTWVRLQ